MTSVDPNIKALLDEKSALYNQPCFIETDPIFVPHQYTIKEDIEISAFFAATLAWGGRPTIIKNSLRLMEIMGHAPYEFVMEHKDHHLNLLDGFVHRTFQAVDAKFFIKALQHIYSQPGGMEQVFTNAVSEHSVLPAIAHFHQIFFSINHPSRTRKHVSNPDNGSPAKRINMFLRWMVRNDNKGVDFGLWKGIRPSQLSCPLDLHTGNTARHLGLISSKQNGLKALHQLDHHLRAMDPEDPVKYDFALFGMGAFAMQSSSAFSHQKK